MNPYPGDNSVIVMDNAKIHHDNELVPSNHGLDIIVILWKHVMILYMHY